MAILAPLQTLLIDIEQERIGAPEVLEESDPYQRHGRLRMLDTEPQHLRRLLRHAR
jgi:hypothetical protein